MSSLLAASSAASSAVQSSAASSAAASAAANMASMSSPSHEVALVAPRPVRISHAAFFHLQREVDHSSDSAGSGSRLSPAPGLKFATFNNSADRSSPRSSLPSEALEEFLSILTPSFMRKPRAFPAFDPRHQRSTSLTTTAYGYNRASQSSTSPVASRASPPALQLLQEQLASRGDGTLTPPRLDAGHWPFGAGRPQNPILSSPVSRMHTRNPFYLHHDSPGARFPLGHPQLPPLSPSPSRSQSQTPALLQPVTPVTPHAVPLPSPSPDELSDRFDLTTI